MDVDASVVLKGDLNWQLGVGRNGVERGGEGGD